MGLGAGFAAWIGVFMLMFMWESPRGTWGRFIFHAQVRPRLSWRRCCWARSTWCVCWWALASCATCARAAHAITPPPPSRAVRQIYVLRELQHCCTRLDSNDHINKFSTLCSTVYSTMCMYSYSTRLSNAECYPIRSDPIDCNSIEHSTRFGDSWSKVRLQIYVFWLLLPVK